MFKHILVPTDFSECSASALEYACTLADAFDSELHLLHIFQEPVPTEPVPGMAFPPPESYLVELKQKVAEELKSAIDAEWEKEHDVIRATAQGAAFVEIIRYAKSMHIELIVMGTHGRSALTHLLIGSVAENVVRKAPCPVLTIRPSMHEFKMP